MDTLSTLIDRREPLAADCPCEAVLDRFIRDSGILALAVTDGVVPLGVVARDAFLARMEVPGSGDLTARAVMSSPPVLIAADTPVDAAIRRLLAEAPEALLSGFVVVDSAGAYEGVGTAVSLLQANPAAAPAAPSDLIERITAEAQGPVQNSLAAIERLRKIRLPDAAQACIDTIAEANSSVLGLLSIAADLQRAQTSELKFSPEPRRLHDLMDQVEGRWRDRAETSGVTLMVSYDGDPGCSAMVDAGRVTQIFDALIGHALANVRHGVIEASLRTSLADGGVKVRGSVRDNGALYGAGYLQNLFDDTTQTGGASLDVTLGLALAARTVSALDGAIAAEANVGAGATITFDIALKGVDDVAQQPEVAAKPSGRSAHVLVVDDNATNRMVVEALCEMFDCSTESVADGLEAVEAARQGRFDVILMDIKMPRMDGVTAAREIRKLAGPAGQAPIIALTANADPDEVREYLSAGMLCVVEKPIKPERLLEALDAALAAGAAKDDTTSAAAAA